MPDRNSFDEVRRRSEIPSSVVNCVKWIWCVVSLISVYTLVACSQSTLVEADNHQLFIAISKPPTRISFSTPTFEQPSPKSALKQWSALPSIGSLACQTHSAKAILTLACDTPHGACPLRDLFEETAGTRRRDKYCLWLRLSVCRCVCLSVVPSKPKY